MLQKLKPFSFLTLLTLASFIAPREIRTAKSGLKMKEFVINTSKYAHRFNPNFIIIPQNGAELAFNKLNPKAATDIAYLNAIDGIAVEDLFYNKKPNVDTYRLKMLRKLKSKKTILVSDCIANLATRNKTIDKSNSEGFLFLARTKSNKHYKEIPKAIQNENNADIVKLSDAKNYLYLLNASEFKSKAHYLKAIAASNYDVVVVDLFFNDKALTLNDVAQLKTKANGGKRLVISYVNIGAAENWRYYWKKNWKLNDPLWLKKNYEGYDEEFYVEFWNPSWKKIIYGNKDSYVKKIINAGFDGAFLDNIEAFYFLYNK